MGDVPQHVWEEKDRRIAKQSMLKAAVEFHSQAVSAGDEVRSIDAVIETADKFVAWVYNENAPREEPSQKAIVISDISHPHPTAEQQKALDIVKEKTGWTPGQVYARFKTFPNMTNVDKCVAKIKE